MDDDTIRRRLGRERRARLEAEAIAERVTAELHAAKTELERVNDELRALNRSLRDFVAVASHDVRGPLTSILGLASTLVRRGELIPADKRDHFLGVIENQARHLGRMVDDLLTISRIEAGELDTHAEVVTLREAIDRVIEGFEDRASGIRIEVADVCAMVDPDHLQRILQNYLGNALKYGAPPVAVEARAAGEWVEVRVRDHGDGVPEELRPRLFGAFARGEESQGGTGLGLSIVRGLARANGGDAWYEPNSGGGSCFCVRLKKIAA